MSDFGKFQVDIPRATDLRQELSAQTNVITQEAQKAQGIMENQDGLNDPIMATIGRIGNMYGQFSSKMKDFQQKADSELDKSINSYSKTLEESDKLLKDAQAQYRNF